jgi:hypothetical protein
MTRSSDTTGFTYFALGLLLAEIAMLVSYLLG